MVTQSSRIVVNKNTENNKYTNENLSYITKLEKQKNKRSSLNLDKLQKINIEPKVKRKTRRKYAKIQGTAT